MVRISNKELIDLLEKNARVSFVEIAKKFKVSDTAIRKRVKKLEKDGIIKRYTIEVDLRKLGFKFHALIGIDTQPENYVTIIEKLKNMEEVKSLFSSTGDHMLLVESWFKTSDELAKFVNKLEKMKGVTRVCPAILLEKLK